MLNHSLFIVAINLLIGITLIWVGNYRMVEIHQLHDTIAKKSVAQVAEITSQFVQDKNRLVNIFAEKEIELIRRLAKSPHDDNLNQQLAARIALYFPNYFNFTIADKQGQPLIVDFEGFVGEVCLQGLKSFAEKRKPLPRIHPNPEAYHFDVLAKYGNNEGILLISFQADILGQTLKSNEAHGHQLLLILEAGQDMIEVTSVGARNRLHRDDYRMSNNEKNRILATKQVPNSAWTATDLSNPALFSAPRNQIIFQSAGTMLVFFFISTLFLWIMWRAEKRRSRAENGRDEFLSTVSHELRTPLTAIRGSLGLTIGGAGGKLPAQAEMLSRTALKNTERMIALVNDLLDLRKLDANQVTLDMHPVNLSSIIKNSINLISDLGQEYGVSYQFTEVNDNVLIKANTRRMEQVLANLLSNATKFGPSNGIVEIELQTMGKIARVEVRDKGPGVPESFQPHLFKKFSQASQKDNKTTQGTGLGLTIVQLIIALHDGRVGYETRKGYGAIFFFELPIAKPG